MDGIDKTVHDALERILIMAENDLTMGTRCAEKGGAEAVEIIKEWLGHPTPMQFKSKRKKK